MATLADSTAYKNPDAILSQHQAALTLLDTFLSKPSIDHLTWLDLACGRGQIIATLNENFSSIARAKIEYSAYDSNSNYHAPDEIQTSMKL